MHHVHPSSVTVKLADARIRQFFLMMNNLKAESYGAPGEDKHSSSRGQHRSAHHGSGSSAAHPTHLK